MHARSIAKNIRNISRKISRRLIKSHRKDDCSNVDHAALFDASIKNNVKPYHHSLFWGDRLLTLDKSAGFLEDQEFLDAYLSVRGSHQYDQYSSPQTIAWRLHTLVWAAKSCVQIEGDFVECGTFKGDMAWVVSMLVGIDHIDKAFYLYDTFDGFSEKYSSDEDFPSNPDFIEYANQFYKDPSLYDDVKKRFSQFKNVKVLKGVVPDILHLDAPEKISFMHIDLNSPAAEVGALEILFPRMSVGGIVVFDDYGWKQFFKQKEAEDAFMSEHGCLILELPTGQGVVIKR